MDRIRIFLTPAADDPQLDSPQYQGDIRDLLSAVKAQGIRISPAFKTMDAAAGTSPGIYTGAFEIAKDALPLIAALLGAWIQARYGRKVRLKVGEIEAEAKSVEEIDELLKVAKRQAKKLSRQEKNRLPLP
jgi:hypothetical protein